VKTAVLVSRPFHGIVLQFMPNHVHDGPPSRQHLRGSYANFHACTTPVHEFFLDFPCAPNVSRQAKFKVPPQPRPPPYQSQKWFIPTKTACICRQLLPSSVHTLLQATEHQRAEACALHCRTRVVKSSSRGLALALRRPPPSLDHRAFANSPTVHCPVPMRSRRNPPTLPHRFLPAAVAGLPLPRAADHPCMLRALARASLPLSS